MSQFEHSPFYCAQEKRSQIIEATAFEEAMVYPLSVAYLWPTKYCPIECEHCMFASPKPQHVDKEMVLSPAAIDNFIQISHDSMLDSLVASGGGEPMLELPTVLRLLKEARFDYFEIITGAHWTASEALIRKTLDQVQDAISERKTKNRDFDFSFRVSIDSYHQAVVRPEWLKSLVDVIRRDAVFPRGERKYPDIRLFFRTLLIEDDTVERFASLLGAKLTPMKQYIRELRFHDELNDGMNMLKVFYKDMRFVGRGKTVETNKLMEFDQYFSSYADENHDVRLGMTYLKPGSHGEALEGINTTVIYDGKMLPYGGVADVYSNIYVDSYQEFLSKLSKDIISRTLLEKGLRSVMRIAEEVDPLINERVKRKNWIASVADESLATPELRLYVTLRLLQESMKEGRIKPDSFQPWIGSLIGVDAKVLQEEYRKYLCSTKRRNYSFGNEVVVYTEDQP